MENYIPGDNGKSFCSGCCIALPICIVLWGIIIVVLVNVL